MTRMSDINCKNFLDLSCSSSRFQAAMLLSKDWVTCWVIFLSLLHAGKWR